MKVLHVVGARPQFIKAAPLLRAMARAEGLDTVLVHTGQHFDSDMSDIFFEDLGLPAPDRHLGVGGGSHADMTGRMLVGLEPVVDEQGPDWVLVYGDTNSTLAAALVASKLHIPVAHVEAGLRSFNRAMPEEINRVVADHLSELCFAPTDAAVENLRREGISGAKVERTGDVMFDAVRLFTDVAKDRSNLLDTFGLSEGGFVLATLHRAENTDDPERLAAAIDGLDEVAQELPVVLPLHPRTAGALERSGIAPKRARTVAPVGYLEMLVLESSAAVVVTDSGGVQKEAFFHRTPCVTLRDETEWVELLELGWNRLSPPIRGRDVAADVLGAIGTIGRDASPYGDGTAAEDIAEAIRARGTSAR